MQILSVNDDEFKKYADVYVATEDGSAGTIF